MRNNVRTRTGIAAAAAALALALGACDSEKAQTPAGPSPAPTVVPTQQDIARQFGVWNSALATGDANKVADLYAPDAVLLPTVSNKVRTNRAEIVDYFEHFLTSKPSGQIEQEVIDILDDNTAINTGVYRFTLTQNGQQQQVQARYTYVYENQGGKWLIVNHHSSAMPEK